MRSIHSTFDIDWQIAIDVLNTLVCTIGSRQIFYAGYFFQRSKLSWYLTNKNIPWPLTKEALPKSGLQPADIFRGKMIALVIVLFSGGNMIAICCST